MRNLFLLLALLLALPVYAEGKAEVAAVSTSGTTARSAKLGPGYKIIYCTQPTYYQTGNSAVVATTADLIIPASSHFQVYVRGSEPYIAFILASSTGSCSIFHLDQQNTSIPPPQHAAGPVIQKGTVELALGAAEVTGITAGSICVCSGPSGGSSVECTLTATTLTLSGSGSEVGSYICVA